MITLEDVVARLKQQDELSIVELLDISSDELVEMFRYKLEDGLDSIINEIYESSVEQYELDFQEDNS